MLQIVCRERGGGGGDEGAVILLRVSCHGILYPTKRFFRNEVRVCLVNFPIILCLL